MKKAIRFGIATVLFGVAALSAAQPQPAEGLLSLDSDGDGRISRQEFRPPQNRRGPKLFERADLNGDGSVTRDEVISSLDQTAEERDERFRGRMLERFDKMDGDGNGVVGREEAENQAFGRMDADGDGFLTQEEARAHRDRRKSGRSRRSERA